MTRFSRPDLPLDLAGIGIGPFNLSLAALLDEARIGPVEFFERRPRFDWHPGMMLPDVALQSSYLKDLVTPVCPTSRWSFLAWLVAQRKFFSFLNAPYEAVPRQEMTNYFAWAAAGLDNLSFGADVREVRFEDGAFRLRLDGQERAARNLVIGTGTRPFRPDWAAGLGSDLAFHCSEAKARLDGQGGKRVVVVGGGQSGGETVEYLLTCARPPAELIWISRRHNFEPINETPFSNQVFSPEYVAAYLDLSEERKAMALRESILTSDGLSLSTIDAIYRALYRIRHIDCAGPKLSLCPGRSVTQVDRRGNSLRLVALNAFDGGIEFHAADALVLATGFRFALPEALAPLGPRLVLDAEGAPIPGRDYALKWDSPAGARIFAQNAGRKTHGIADSQLSLMAWRSAAIVNALTGRAVYDLGMPEPVVHWASLPGKAMQLEREPA
jgi:lysine N6-hydroxylase